MNNRSGNVDLARFIASMFIMEHHIYITLGYSHFESCWIYIEFFLIITGYYFCEVDNECIYLD